MRRELLFPWQEFLDFCRGQRSGNGKLNGGSDTIQPGDAGMVAAPLSESNLVCSDRRTDDLHIPVLDIDMPALLMPSSTPGHHHLFIDKPMTWEQYKKLLDVMAEVGILEPGYVVVAKKRKRTQVRTPWTKK